MLNLWVKTWWKWPILKIFDSFYYVFWSIFVIGWVSITASKILRNIELAMLFGSFLIGQKILFWKLLDKCVVILKSTPINSYTNCLIIATFSIFYKCSILKIRRTLESILDISKIGITKPLLSRFTRSRPRAPDFISLANKSFENKFNHERESKGLVMPFLDIPHSCESTTGGYVGLKIADFRNLFFMLLSAPPNK